MCKASRDNTGLGNRSNELRFGCLSETKVLLIFAGRKNDPPEVWRSFLRQNSNSLNDQKTEPNKEYDEVGHVTDSIDHECVQAYDSMCIEDVVLYLDCYVHIWNHFENEIEKPSQKYLV